MKILEDPRQCYGCTACFNACGTGAITMVLNDEGFIEPLIDQDACIECGKCQSVCPIVSPNPPAHADPLEALGFAAGKRTMDVSSSGGAFSVLAEHMLADDSGHVVGAAFEDGYDVRHRIVSDAKDLAPLRLTKYAQSDQGTSYRDVKDILKRGERVLYVGCPCQIAGLRSYLGKMPTDKLITVDLICHGGSSAKLFQAYLEDFYGENAIRSLSMRRPDIWRACVHVSLTNGTEETRAGAKDPYLKAMLGHISLRPSCYGCAYARLPRQGDITLGDLWGAKGLDIDAVFKRRSSVVLLNSPQGQAFWHEAVDGLDDCNVVQFGSDVALEAVNKHIVRASTKSEPAERAAFMKRLPETGFVKAAYADTHPYDVGLILYASNNYGSTATNVALYKAVENLGYAPVVLDSLVPPKGVSADYLPKHLAVSSTFMEEKDWRLANHLLDTFVIGSDQSLNWNFGLTKDNYESLLMCFADDTKNLVAFSTSLGHERYNMHPDIQLLYTQALARFNSFSVREDYAVGMCERLFNLKADHVVDPVFLMAPDEYRQIAADSTDVIDEPYLYAYILVPDEGKRALVLQVAEQLGLRAVVSFDASFYDDKRKEFNLDQTVDQPDFPTWVGYFANASFVITDSFHGVCLSTIMHKPFMGVKARQKQRFDSFDASMGFSERGEEVFFENSQVALKAAIPTFDWDAAEEHISAFRNQSIEWLREALAGRPRSASAPTGASELLMRFAPMARDKVAREAQLKGSYDEAMRKQVKADRDKGKSALETSLRIAGAKNSTKDFDLRERNDVKAYFDEIRRARRFVLLISTRDDCTKLWGQFLAQSGLSLQSAPEKDEGYVAVVDESGSVLLEEARLGTMTKRFTVDGGSTKENARKMKRLHNDRRAGKLQSLLSPAQVSLHAGTFTKRGDGEMRSLIAVNNIECSVNGSGVNVVVLERSTGKVADSICISMKGTSLRIAR